jgi:hypothetical protein
LPKKGALLNHVEGINMDFFFLQMVTLW